MNQVKESSSIRKIETALRHYAFGDIVKVSKGDNVLATFILCSCFIEQMATFRYGKEVGGKEFKDFVEAYMKSYDPVKLRNDLRNKLVHNYSLGESYTLVQGYKDLHLKLNENTLIINLENFIDDLGSALDTLMNEFKTNLEIRNNALKALKDINIISGSEIQITID